MNDKIIQQALSSSNIINIGDFAKNNKSMFGSSNNYMDIINARNDETNNIFAAASSKGFAAKHLSVASPSDYKKTGLGGLFKGKYHPDNVFRHDPQGNILYTTDKYNTRYFATSLKGIKDCALFLIDHGENDPYNIFANNTYYKILYYYENITKEYKYMITEVLTWLFKEHFSEITNLSDISMVEIEKNLDDYLYIPYYGYMDHIGGGIDRDVVAYEFTLNGKRMGLSCCGPNKLYKEFIGIIIIYDTISNQIYYVYNIIPNKKINYNIPKLNN